jgi:hypothetical protein
MRHNSHTPATMAATMLSSRTVSYRVEPDMGPDMERLACRFRLELESSITLPACRARQQPWRARASGAGWHLKKVA